MKEVENIINIEPGIPEVQDDLLGMWETYPEEQEEINRILADFGLDLD